MLLATVALALVVGAVFATLLITIEDARDAQRSALHSQDVLIAANGLEQRVLDLETGQRGFILTHQMEFLAPWQRALAALPREGLALRRLVAGDPAQEARVREIIAGARSYIDEYSMPLVKAAARHDPSATTVASTAEGEARIDVIRTDFEQLLEAERRTSAASARASTDAAHRAYAGALIGVAVSIALVALYAGYLSRAIVRPIRRAAALTGRVAGGDLSARLSETGVGEIGALQRAFNVMGAALERNRDELAALAEEQAGLRRVATLVAQDASADDTLAAVAYEIGQLLPADYVLIGRYHADGTEFRTVGNWSRGGDSAGVPTTLAVGGRNVTALVWQTRRPARLDPDEPASGPVAPYHRALGVRSSVGVPINVEGHLWGIVIAASTRKEPMPDDTETRLGRFTELVSTAIANTHSRDQLTASRARLVTAADAARGRVVRDLHDGAQQRLVHTVITLELAERALERGDEDAKALLGEALRHAQRANEELRELAHGILPADLTHGGLSGALDAIVERLDLAVDVDLPPDRFPAEIEASAYFVVAEALTNVIKHAQAESAEVSASIQDGMLHVEVRDDGIGGADPGGHGLLGMHDRVTALGGELSVESGPGGGTVVTATLPTSLGRADAA
jgi:signal transduction histidine kinase